MTKPIFEVCLESVEGVIAAREGGADRVELCAGLVAGGLTPSWGTIRDAVQVGIDVMVMIRPRGGDFAYSERELEVMITDIHRSMDLGVKGVVFGVLETDGTLATKALKRLVRAAGDLDVTFHRAFDVCRDPMKVMSQLSDLGINRVLTSGQQATVMGGIDLIRELVERAPRGFKVMPGCGITPENLQEVLEVTCVREYHATALRQIPSPMKHRNESVYMGVPGIPEYEREITSAERVREFVTVAETIQLNQKA